MESALGAYSQSGGFEESESVTTGDVLFMHAGKLHVTFEQIEDSDGMVQMSRSAIWQSKKNTRVPSEETKLASKTWVPAQAEDIQCKKCQSYNLDGSEFCNRCGQKL